MYVQTGFQYPSMINDDQPGANSTVLGRNVINAL